MNAFIASKSFKIDATGMHATARNYALKHRAPLRRYGEEHGARAGYYYLATGSAYISMQPTAKSAIAMMKLAGYR